MVSRNLEVYCDESSLENLFKDNKSGYIVIGGIWLDKKDHKIVKKEIDHLKRKHSIGGEFKWNKVSYSRKQFYFEILDYFFGNRKIRFTCIVVNTKKVNTEKYHNSDNELGFYKFYFNLLDKWCNNRLPKLKEILNYVSEGEIIDVLPIRSEESVFIQLADLLSGVVSFHFNNNDVKDNTKYEFKKRLEEHIGESIKSSPSSEKKV